MSLQKSVKKVLERATYDKRQLHRQILKLSSSAEETEKFLKNFSGKASISSAPKKKKYK